MLDASAEAVLKDYVPSLVISLPEKNAILKLVRARKWVEYVKLLWNNSRASKEIHGNDVLHAIGIKVPRIYEAGLGLVPSPGYQFLGYYIMEDLRVSGYENSRFLFLENRIDAGRRKAFLENVMADIDRMRANRIVFSDFKFENIFCNQAGDTIWIDTGINVFTENRQADFMRRHDQSLDYFLEHHAKFLDEAEIAAVKQRYFNGKNDE